MDRPFLCPACDVGSAAFAPGPGGRPNARCSNCDALERHRFAALLFEDRAAVFSDARTVLDVAPQRQTQRKIRDLATGRYVGLDLDPDRRPDVVASLTELPMPTGSVDVIVCMHVLEHIADDRAAIAELARVLTSTGSAFIQVPRRPGTLTDEDPDAAPDERVRRFGQADHVRYYGDDFEERLRRGGLSPTAVWPAMLLNGDEIARFGLKADEWMWIATTTRSGDDLLPTRREIAADLAATRRELRRITSHPIVAGLRALKARFKRSR